MSLGKLVKVNLRNYWKNEAREFTPWLAELDNLQLLADTLDIDIELEGTEVPVGNFQADILAQSERGRKIIIENQLDKTNHDHLGKIITYASGTDAQIIIWVCTSVREEHRKAIDWLNEISGEGVDFFAIEIELWKIDNSAPAPKFNIVCSPNEWAKAARIKTQTQITEIRLLRKEFWSELRDYMVKNKAVVKPRTPSVDRWYDFSIGRSGFHIALTINTKINILSCELYISGDKAKEAFNLLKQDSNAIEAEIGYNLDWRELPDSRDCRIVFITDGDIRLRDKWYDYMKWCHDHVELFYRAFADRVKQLEV